MEQEELLPNIEHIIAMYIRKEVLVSSQTEGTQASLEDAIFLAKREKSQKVKYIIEKILEKNKIGKKL